MKKNMMNAVKGMMLVLASIFAACGNDSETNANDSYVYEGRTVVIGNQVWMAENLNIETEGSVCFDASPTNCEKYGRLYSWRAAMNVCPSGWHLPTLKDFETLLDYVGESSSLRAIEWNGGQDTYGFSALPAGYGIAYDFVYFYSLGASAHFWSSTEDRENAAYFMGIGDINMGVSLESEDLFYSVRCVKPYDGSEEYNLPDVSSDSSCFEFEETFDIWSGDSLVCVDGNWITKPAVENSSNSESSSSVVDSSSEMMGSSSSEEEIESSGEYDIESSSENDIESSSEEKIAEVMPFGYYNCDDYDCVSRSYLNQYMLSSREYGEILDSRDNTVYNVVTIGDQVWMAQNLEYSYNVGTALSVYNSGYGVLYMWSAAMDSAAIFSNDGVGCGESTNCIPNKTVRGVCPRGWHLPTQNELETLINFVELHIEFGSQSCSITALRSSCKAGKYLESSEGNWIGERYDEFGFSALPAGNCSVHSYPLKCSNVNYYANFWSSNEYSSNSAVSLSLDYKGEALITDDSKQEAISIRCLKDDE